MHFFIAKGVEKGCTQGSKAGLRCWNIPIDSLLPLFENERNTKIIAYADDTTLLIGESSRVELEFRASALLPKTSNWSSNNKLNFNSAKTECVVLKGLRKEILYYRDVRRDFIIVTESYKTISNDTLPIIAGVLPVEYLLKYRSLRFNRLVLALSGLISDWDAAWQVSQKGRALYEVISSPAEVINRKLEFKHA